jgi:hypothetical protein
MENVCCRATKSRCAQYTGTVGNVRRSGIRNERPWSTGREMCAGVQTAHNRAVGVCESMWTEFRDHGLGTNEIYGIAGRGGLGENVKAPRRSQRALNRKMIVSNDDNPLIDGRGGRRRMRDRLNVVERDGGQEGIDIEVWKGKLHYEEI